MDSWETHGVLETEKMLALAATEMNEVLTVLKPSTGITATERQTVGNSHIQVNSTKVSLSRLGHW